MRCNPLIVRAMKRTAFLLAILIAGATSAAAQSTEFGILIGGTKRVIDDNLIAAGTEPGDDAFRLSNQSLSVYYGFELDPGTMFKIKAGRMETPIGFLVEEIQGPDIVDVRRDVDGEVQHVEGIIEYRFSEIFGSTGIFGGVGAYRHEADNGSISATDYGFTAGITGDFPMTRRYGVILEAAYHWTHHDFDPNYFTLSAGLRLAF